MEMILNLIFFTDFYFIEILTSLIWFFSTLIFSPTPALKTYTVRLQNYHEFSTFFLCGELHRFVDITWTLRTSKFNPNTNKYLYSFQKLVDASFFINISCNFPDQRKVGHDTSIFTETNVYFMRFFAQRHLLFKSS